MPRVSVSIDCNAIQHDLDKLNNMNGRTNKIDRDNIKAIKKYLYKIAEYIDSNDSIQLKWSVKNNRLTSEPIELIHLNPYGIKATDYVNVGKSKLVHADYREVLEIIAFEMMFRDLGETHKSIEEKLINVGITTLEPSNVLTQFIDGSPLDYSKFMKIGDSPYATIDGKMSWDYFSSSTKNGDKAFTSGMYRECVGRSVDIANMIIMKNVVNNLNINKAKYGLCAINEDGIYMVINNADSIDMSSIFESVSVRAFGRMFEVVPNIEIF